MGISGERLTTSLTLSAKILNKKQRTRTAITEITKQGFRKLLKKFIILTYLCYNNKHVHNEPTKDYLFIIKHISKKIKIKNHVRLRNTIFKLDVNGRE